MDIIRFGADQIDNLVAQDPTRLDRLPFGAVLLDRHGTVQKYNAYEAALSRRSPAEVIGRNFFEDIAPCTKGHQFEGRFREGVASGSLNVMFEYVFQDSIMPPTGVRIHMKSASVAAGIWVFIKRL